MGNTLSGEPDAADGTVNVDGTGSQFHALRLLVGLADNGGAAAVGTVNVTDHASLASTGSQIQLGSGGTGYLNVSGGSAVTSVMGTSPSFSSGIIGAAYPGYYGVGFATLSDAGTSWTQDGSLSVGFTGNGTLTVQSGAVVSSRWGHVGRRAGSVGQATVTGDGSSWDVQDELYVGGEAGADRGGLGAGGQGRLDVRDGGVVTVGQRVELWDQDTVDLTGGGRLRVGAGAVPADRDRLYVGPGGLLAGTGTVLGTVVNLGGVIAPGHSIGTLSVDELDQQSGSIEFQIGGLVPGVDYDVLNVQGNALLNGQLTLIFTGGFLPRTGQTFDLLQVGQDLSGVPAVQIVGLDPGWDYGLAGHDGGLRLTSYNDATPEPLTLSLLLLGGLAVVGRRGR